jgi:hypothetical protein
MDAKDCVHRKLQLEGFPEAFAEYQKANEIEPGNDKHLVIEIWIGRSNCRIEPVTPVGHYDKPSSECGANCAGSISKERKTARANAGSALLKNAFFMDVDLLMFLVFRT